MEKYEDARGAVGAGDDSEALLAEFRSWLGRERGLAAESARCYANQVKAFLAGAGGPRALGGLDAGQVTASRRGSRRTGTRGLRRGL